VPFLFKISIDYSRETMIIECPECGAKNQTTQPPQPGKRYRCGKCGAVVTFLDTIDTTSETTKSAVASRTYDIPKRRNTMNKWIVIPIIALLVIGLVSTGYAYASKTSQLNAEIDGLSETIGELESEKANLEENIEEVKSDLDSAKGEITSLESSLDRVNSDYNALSNELTELRTFYDGIFKGEPPPYYKPQNELMNIVENASAKDPTWQQLVDFLKTDLTDGRKYVLEEYVCTGFTEDLHNNAEALGIRSAVVFVHFEDSEIGHSLNAFNTVDRGLVFIDNTGVSGFTNRAWDRVAYLRIGEQYGCITVDAGIESFEYEYYELKYEQLQVRIDQYERNVEIYYGKLRDYNSALRSYNAEVQEFNAALQAYAYLTYGKYLMFSAWEDSLKAERKRLNRWSARLDSIVSHLDQELVELGIQYDQYGGVLGVVKEVEMYW